MIVRYKIFTRIIGLTTLICFIQVSALINVVFALNLDKNLLSKPLISAARLIAHKKIAPSPFSATTTLPTSILDENPFDWGPTERQRKEWTRVWKNKTSSAYPGVSLHLYKYEYFLTISLKYILNKFTKYKTLTMLNVGSGAGDDTSNIMYILKYLKQILSMEARPIIWTTDIADVESYNPEFHVKAAATYMPFNREENKTKFNIGFTFLVYDYLSETERKIALLELNRVFTKKNSFAILFLHHSESGFSKGVNHSDSYYPKIIASFKPFSSEQEIRQMIAGTGFNILKLEMLIEPKASNGVDKIWAVLLKKTVDVEDIIESLYRARDEERLNRTINRSIEQQI